MADRWGRKLPIIIGCLLMILGGFLGAFCKDYGSMYLLLVQMTVTIADVDP
jgi:MFS family permease